MKRLATILPTVAALVLITNLTALAQQPQNSWYFGMNVQLEQDWSGKSLRVMSVTPGGPAARAGLEPGDQIRSVNGRTFQRAYNNYQAIAILQQAVSGSGGGGGTPTLFVNPNPQGGRANLLVRDIRTGNFIGATVFPQFVGGGGGGVPTRVR